MDCIFCKIVRKEIKTDFLYEDENLVVFNDIRRDAPVHELIVPKEHIQSISTLEDHHKEIVSKLIFTAKAMAEEAKLKGYKLLFNVGREGGQVIDHLHLHLMGGWNPTGEKSEMNETSHPKLDK